MSAFAEWAATESKPRTVVEWMALHADVANDILAGIKSGLTVSLAHQYLRARCSYPFEGTESLSVWVRRQMSA